MIEANILQFLLILIISLQLLVQCARYSPNLQDNTDSAEFQAINTYLTNRHSMSSNISDVVSSLARASETIHTLGVDNFLQVGPQHSVIYALYSSLLGNNPHVLLTIIKDLIWVSDSCEPTSVGYLELLIDQRTFNGQFLNQFGRDLLLKCWLLNLEVVDTNIEKSLIGMSPEIFEYLDRVASYALLLERQHSERVNHVLLISQEMSKLNAIKHLNSNIKELKTVAQSIKKLFIDLIEIQEGSETISSRKIDEFTSGELKLLYKVTIIEPCSELTERIRKALGIIFISITPKLPEFKTREALESKLQSSPKFDYNLEASRMCRELNLKEESILSMF